jgi:hypothetical protein
MEWQSRLTESAPNSDVRKSEPGLYRGDAEWGQNQLHKVVPVDKNIRNCNKYWFKDPEKCVSLVTEKYKFPGRLRKMTGYRISKGGSRRRRSRRYTLRKK